MKEKKHIVENLPDTVVEVQQEQEECRPESRMDKIDELDRHLFVLVDNELDNNMTTMKLKDLKYKKKNHHLKNNNKNNRLNKRLL